MTRNPETNSPSIPRELEDDWLEDLDKPTAQERAAEIPFEKQYKDAEPDELENRLEAIAKELEPFTSEEKLRTIIGDKKGAKRPGGRVKFLQVEQRVLSKMLQEMEAEVVDVVDDTLERVTAIEARREAEEVADAEENKKMDQLVKEAQAETIRRERELAVKLFDEDNRKRELAKIAKAKAEQIAQRRKEETRFEKDTEAEELARQEQEKVRFEKDTKRERFLEAAKPNYAVQGARKAPESFWARAKRTWFGGASETVKQNIKAKETFNANVRAQDKQREATQQTHNDLAQYRVISARKGGSPTAEPGFFGKLWKRFSGQTERETTANTFGENTRSVAGNERLTDKYRGLIKKEKATEELPETAIKKLDDVA